MITADVCVVGGGPAGAAAALTLARAGRHVVVVDKARFPRDKACGDGLTAAALRQLEALGLRREHIPSWQVVERAWLRSPSGQIGCFPLPEGPGTYMVVARRTELDAALLDLARGAGATVCDGHALTSATAGADGLDLEVEGLGRVRAPFAIGADGMWSPLGKALGAHPPGYLGEWHAFRQYFTGVSGTAASDVWVWMEPDLLPGYAWSFPLPGGRANVGFGVQRVRGRSVRFMAELWPQLLARDHIREVLGEGAGPEAPHRAWPIPARIHTATLAAAGGRALFVGDAAGATDPMTGEGIAQALETGVMAAEAVLGAGPDRPEEAAARYRQAVAAGFLADHRMARALSGILSHRKGAAAAIWLASLTPWTRGNFARWLFEDYPRAVVATPRRWRRGVLAGPGAYR